MLIMPEISGGGGNMNKNKKIPKAVWIPLVSVGGALLLGLLVFLLVYFCVLKVDVKAFASQVDQTQAIELKWDAPKQFDSVKLSVYHGNDLVNVKYITKASQMSGNKTTIEGYYGKMTVKAQFKKGIYSTTKTFKINLSADEYNIAPITATMPVTLFTLSLDEITNKGTIPTFVWFKRSGAWDWTKLPQNVYEMPVATAEQFLNSDQNVMYSSTSKWVKELYSINKNSKFNFYYNDYYAYGWMQATIANGIPAENYKVTLLSDGTASFNYFNKHLNNANYASNYEAMKNDYLKLKNEIASKKKYTESSKGFTIDANTLREYAFVMAKEEPNVEWWLTRTSGTLGTYVLDSATNKTVYSEFVSPTEGSAIQVKDLKTLLVKIDPRVNTANAGKTDEEIEAMVANRWFKKADLKALYKFSDTMFEKAEKEHKQVMIILGTWTETEQADYFDNYVKAIKAYYGDNFVYYYKGHPKNPTDTVEGKRAHLENDLNLIDIDSTIPAELIFFFNPEAFGSGYDSSTFLSVSAEKTCAIIKARKSGFSQSYKDNVDMFMSTNTLNAEKTGFEASATQVLIEFNNTTAYDIAIYDVTTNAMKYYKLNNTTSVYDEVQVVG